MAAAAARGACFLFVGRANFSEFLMQITKGGQTHGEKEKENEERSSFMNTRLGVARAPPRKTEASHGMRIGNRE